MAQVSPEEPGLLGDNGLLSVQGTEPVTGAEAEAQH